MSFFSKQVYCVIPFPISQLDMVISLCLCGVLNRLCTLLHVCYSSSICLLCRGAGANTKWVLDSVCVCVHPLVCVIVKKHCHLLWNGERVIEHKSLGRFVHWKQDVLAPKGLSSFAKKYRKNHCTTWFKFVNSFPYSISKRFATEEGLLGPKCLSSANKCTVWFLSLSHSQTW